MDEMHDSFWKMIAKQLVPEIGIAVKIFVATLCAVLILAVLCGIFFHDYYLVDKICELLKEFIASSSVSK